MQWWQHIYYCNNGYHRSAGANPLNCSCTTIQIFKNMGQPRRPHFLQVTSDNTLMIASPFPFSRPQVHLGESSTSWHWMWWNPRKKVAMKQVSLILAGWLVQRWSFKRLILINNIKWLYTHKITIHDVHTLSIPILAILLLKEWLIKVNLGPQPTKKHIVTVSFDWIILWVESTHWGQRIFHQPPLNRWVIWTESKNS